MFLPIREVPLPPPGCGVGEFPEAIVNNFDWAIYTDGV